MSSLTDQSRWEFPLSKSSSCYLHEAEGSCLPGISQNKAHRCWQVFVSMWQSVMQRNTVHSECFSLNTAWKKVEKSWTLTPRISTGECKASWNYISSGRGTSYLLNAELIPTACCDFQNINGFWKDKIICGGNIQKNMLNRIVWVELMPLFKPIHSLLDGIPLPVHSPLEGIPFFRVSSSNLLRVHSIS